MPVGKEHRVQAPAFGGACEFLVEGDVAHALDRRLRMPPRRRVMATTKQESVEVQHRLSPSPIRRQR